MRVRIFRSEPPGGPFWVRPDKGEDFHLLWTPELARHVQGDFADFDAVRVGGQLAIDVPEEPDDSAG